MCQNQTSIIDLVNDQPDPNIFYKPLFEFDGANMVSVLAFDSRSMKYLLNEKFDDYFSDEYPIFFRNKI